MTPEQKYDRWERVARLLYEDATRRARKSRKQTTNLKFYLDAVLNIEPEMNHIALLHNVVLAL